MKRFPFVTVVTVLDGAASISHLPVTVSAKDQFIEITGHLARANPHCIALSQGGVTTVIFHGPHAYITPKWYQANDVPTWNYLTLHAYGRPTLFEEYDALVECVKSVSAHAEELWPSGWEFFVPDDLAGSKLSRGIAGFKIKVDQWTFKKKLHQSAKASDRAGVLRGLAGRSDDNGRETLAEMKKLFHDDGTKRE